MGALRLHAIAIDDVRDVVGADEPLRARLHQIAETAFARPEAPATHGLLGRLGPIFRRPPQALVLSPDDPTPQDLDRLLAGQHPRPDRALATWRLLERLVEGLAWGSTDVDLDSSERDALDFDLARAGLSSEVGLGRLLCHDARIGVMPPPGEVAAARPHHFAVAMAEAWAGALAEDSPPLQESRHRDALVRLSHWLDGFRHWGRVAAEQGRPAPDLVAFTTR